MILNKIKKTTLVLITILSLTILSGCSKEEVVSNEEFKNISTSELQSNLDNDSWVIVDTRINDAYNGWALDGVSRGGHILNAVDFSANWLKVENKDKEETLEKALETKGINKDKNIVLYDSNGTDAKEVANYLHKKGYENLYI